MTFEPAQVVHDYVDQAPSLAPWGPLAAQIARLITLHPTLAKRLMCAPRKAFHSVALYLLHNGDRDELELGNELLRRSPRDLLAECLTPAPTLFSTLKRCGSAVKTTGRYGAAAGPRML